MSPLLESLGVSNPVLAAPMAGGPTTPALVAAAARAGSLGFLPGGYQSVEALAAQIETVRESTSVFGVNLFAPNPVPVDPARFRAYAAAIQAVADGYGIDLRDAEPIEDDDSWSQKVEHLLASTVPAVSFTFGIPGREIVAAFRRSATVTIQTVTSVAEAEQAQDAGIDALAVQAFVAGGHYGTLTPDRLPEAAALPDLVAAILARTRVPVIAAGGLSKPDQVADILRSGAAGVMVGTVLLRSAESGASAVHQAALASPGSGSTIITRAFTGRPARAIPNAFTDRFDSLAPAGYPAIHHLTRGLRRAAAADGNPEFVNLWAGVGYRDAPVAPVGEILEHLASG